MHHPMATRMGALLPARGTRLFVSGVAPDVKKTDIQQQFGEFGHVVDIELPMTARGVAFVQFDNARDAQEAMEEVTGRRLKGMVLKVKPADVKPEKRVADDAPARRADTTSPTARSRSSWKAEADMWSSPSPGRRSRSRLRMDTSKSSNRGDHSERDRDGGRRRRSPRGRKHRHVSGHSAGKRSHMTEGSLPT